MHQIPVFWWTFYEGQVRKNVKTCNEYDNDPIKCLLNKKKKTRMKVDHKIKNIKILFYHVNCDF